jgi:hypothetical protein
MFQLHRLCKQEGFFLLTTPMKMGETELSETSEHKFQTLGNHPKERINTIPLPFQFTIHYSQNI